MSVSERTAVWLDKNECPYGEEGLNRYPPREHAALHAALAGYYGVETHCVLATRGSDDAIDALGRAFLRPGTDAVMVTPPTFGMYAEFARLQGAAVVEAPNGAEAMIAAWNPGVKITWVCSPNNPTGTVMDPADIQRLCETLDDRALVAVDEAYQEFSSRPSAVALLSRYPNLVVLRTLSKAFGLAALRVGVLLGAPELVRSVRRALPPYLLPTPVAELALQAFAPDALARMRSRVADIVRRRDAFAARMAALPGVSRVLNGEANSILVRFEVRDTMLSRLADAGIHVRAFPEWVRFTIGTEEEMERAEAALRRS